MSSEWLLDGYEEAAAGRARNEEAGALPSMPSKAQTQSDLSASSPSSITAGPTTTLSPAQSLYRDGLCSILRYLSLGSLHSASLACRSWLDAVSCAQRIFSLSAEVAPALWGPMSRSTTLRNHISVLDSTTGSAAAAAAAAIDSLHPLRSLPHLTDLTVSIDYAALRRFWASEDSTSDDVEDLAQQGWPQGLKSLCLEVAWPRLQREDRAVEGALIPPLQLLVDLAGNLDSLTTLRLDFEASPTPRSLDLAPLRKLTRLADLDLIGMQVGSEQLQVLRQMVSLEWVQPNATGVWSVFQLEQLCGPPPPPHSLANLAQLALIGTDLSAEHMRALVNLPALAFLQPRSFARDALPFLAQLSNLGYVRVRVRIASGSGQARSSAGLFLPHLTRCSKLTQVDLVHCTITEMEMRELVTAWPLLHSLTLSDVDPLPNLRALVAAPGLRSLRIEACERIRGLQLLQLAGIPNLRALAVSLPSEDVDLARELLTPPSSFLPQLTSLHVEALAPPSSTPLLSLSRFLA